MGKWALCKYNPPHSQTWTSYLNWKSTRHEVEATALHRHCSFPWHRNGCMFHAFNHLHAGFVALLVVIHFFPSDFLLTKSTSTEEFHSALWSNTCNSSQKWARFRPVTHLIEVNLAKHKKKRKKKKGIWPSLHSLWQLTHCLFILRSLQKHSTHSITSQRKGSKGKCF